jgi:cytochrome c-type biogenesis protein CcmH
MKRLLLCLYLAFAAAPAFAQVGAQVAGSPEIIRFSDPATETRARALQRQLRCLICQGESVDESGSPFAAEVRQLVRRQIAEGRSDRQIQDFLVARYGDVILMKPPVQPDTWLLWLAPFLVLVVAGGVAWMTVRRAQRAAST